MTGTVWTDHGDEPLPARVRSWEVEAHTDDPALRPVAAQERIEAALAWLDMLDFTSDATWVAAGVRRALTGDATAAEAYAAGRWCGECRYGVVEDPPCCTVASPTEPGPPSYPECHETVTDDDGIEGPCNYHAVRDRLDPEEGSSYPVCAVHDRPPYPVTRMPKTRRVVGTIAPPGLVEALRALTVTFAAFERTYAVHKADTYAEGARDAWDLAESKLRGLLDQYDDSTGNTETVHACPEYGGGLTPCCGRTLFELPASDRVTVDEAVTCTGSGR